MNLRSGPVQCRKVSMRFRLQYGLGMMTESQVINHNLKRIKRHPVIIVLAAWIGLLIRNLAAGKQPVGTYQAIYFLICRALIDLLLIDRETAAHRTGCEKSFIRRRLACGPQLLPRPGIVQNRCSSLPSEARQPCCVLANCSQSSAAKGCSLLLLYSLIAAAQLFSKFSLISSSASLMSRFDLEACVVAAIGDIVVQITEAVHWFSYCQPWLFNTELALSLGGIDFGNVEKVTLTLTAISMVNLMRHFVTECLFFSPCGSWTTKCQHHEFPVNVAIRALVVIFARNNNAVVWQTTFCRAPSSPLLFARPTDGYVLAFEGFQAFGFQLSIYPLSNGPLPSTRPTDPLTCIIAFFDILTHKGNLPEFKGVSP